MYKIIFKIENENDVEVYANEGEKLLDVAKNANVVIDAPCSGNVSCGKCKVKLLDGELKSEITWHITEEEYNEGWRLACNSKICSDVIIEVPDVASAFKTHMKVADLSSLSEVAIFNKTKEDIINAGINFENDLEIVKLEINPPSLDDTRPDNTRLIWAVEAATGVDKTVIPYNVMKKLPQTLRNNSFKVKCVISKNNNRNFIYDIAGIDEDVVAAGIAVDIGTTTVSALIVNMLDGTILAKGSAGNGQIRYGADVINRIIESSKTKGIEKLQKAIIDETINPIIENMCNAAKISSSSIYRMCVASNTTMNHLFAGIFAEAIRMEPYIPAFFKTNSIYAKDLKIKINPEAHIIISPNIGSYVGGDITAGVLANTMWNDPEFSLFIDLGTNGEIVFGNSDFLMSCACSAGPAFEGGDISCGMRATDGAIEACKIDSETMVPEFIVVGDCKPVGLCGSGIIDLISELYRCKMISPKGIFIREGERIRHDEYGMGSYVLAFKEDAGSIKDIEITEVDIDSFIRAKGAIFSAINLMLESLDFDPSILEKVYVAGGIGSGINMENAMNIGMFPKLPVEKYHYIGNSSLSGAYTILLSRIAEKKVYDLANSITYMELSTNPKYMDEFVAACFIPHTNAALFD